MSQTKTAKIAIGDTQIRVVATNDDGAVRYVPGTYVGDVRRGGVHTLFRWRGQDVDTFERHHFHFARVGRHDDVWGGEHIYYQAEVPGGYLLLHLSRVHRGSWTALCRPMRKPLETTEAWVEAREALVSMFAVDRHKVEEIARAYAVLHGCDWARTAQQIASLTTPAEGSSEVNARESRRDLIELATMVDVRIRRVHLGSLIALPGDGRGEVKELLEKNKIACERAKRAA